MEDKTTVLQFLQSMIEYYNGDEPVPQHTAIDWLAGYFAAMKDESMADKRYTHTEEELHGIFMLLGTLYKPKEKP